MIFRFPTKVQHMGWNTECRKMYSINFTVTRNKFCLSLDCNGANSYLLMVKKLLNSKQKILRL